MLIKTTKDNPTSATLHFIPGICGWGRARIRFQRRIADSWFLESMVKKVQLNFSSGHYSSSLTAPSPSPPCNFGLLLKSLRPHASNSYPIRCTNSQQA